MNVWSLELFSVNQILVRLGPVSFPELVLWTTCACVLSLEGLTLCEALPHLGVDLNRVKEVLAGQSIEIVLYL